MTTPDELVAAAAALAPRLRARQAAAEAARTVPRESIEEMIDAGLYRVMQPTAYGGCAFGVDTFVRVSIEVAAACGSTGWVYATGAQHQWQIGMFAPEAQAEVWGADARALAASSYAPTGVAVPDGEGYRVTGTWSFCSGVDICQWMILGVRVVERPDGPTVDNVFVLVPEADYRIEDNWRVLGLNATGSKNIHLDAVFVPAHRVLTVAQSQSGASPGTAVNREDIFRIPFPAAISYCLCASVLGIGRGAVEDFIARTRAGAHERHAASGRSLLLERCVGAASSGVDAAIELVLRDCRDITASVAAGGTPSQEMRARNKGDIGFAARLVTDSVDMLYRYADDAGAAGGDLLERAWRDAHSAAQHISLNFDAVSSLYGRVALGLPAGPAQF